MSEGDASIRRVSELRDAQHGDPMLRILVGLLESKLQLSARLPVLTFEADQEGHEDCARLFRSLAISERDQIAQLLTVLRSHLDATSDGAGTKET